MAVLYTREDWTLFRNLGTLTQKAGVEQGNLSQLVVKELVDNALDEAGSCTVGLLEGNGFFVEDQGDGIPGCPSRSPTISKTNRPTTGKPRSTYPPTFWPESPSTVGPAAGAGLLPIILY